MALSTNYARINRKRDLITGIQIMIASSDATDAMKAEVGNELKYMKVKTLAKLSGSLLRQLKEARR